MVYKTLEITLISAKDLKTANFVLGKMDVYVAVHLSDDTKNKQKTPVHQNSGNNPTWNYTMRFTIDDAIASKPGKYVVFTLKHEQTFGSDKELGEVLVPLKELLDGVKDPNSPQVVTYQVRRVSSGKAQGELKLSYKFIDMPQNFDKPPQSCSSSSSNSVPYPPSGSYPNFYPPPPHHQAAAGYPAPQSHGMPYPPPESHGKPAAAGMAYPPGPESHGKPAATGMPYPPPAESHGKPTATGVPYPPPESHGKPAGTAMAYPPPEGYPSQGHGSGVPYAAPQGYPPYGGYPPPPHGYGYPQPGGYPPPPGSYPAYPPQQQGYAQKPQKPKKNNFGMGLGAGLLGGAIGGLVLGEMVEDSFDFDCDF